MSTFEKHTARPLAPRASVRRLNLRLPTLGGRLKLPTGWRYDTMTPDADLVLGAKGKATIVQDDLADTYQKLD